MLRELPELAGARLALAAARAASAHLCQGATFAPGSRYLHRRGPAPLGGQQPLSKRWKRRKVRAVWEARGVFDALGKRSIESPHFPLRA